MPDSPLSIAASITGLLTFVAAVVAGFYAHALGLRDAIDTQAEISSALDKIYLLETETDMLNNAYLASLIRQPDRKYGTGDFKYFQGLYVQSLERMRVMDRDLRTSAESVTKGDGYGRISRVKRKAAWMASRTRIQRDIDERKTESIRIFQIQLAMLSAAKDDKASIGVPKDGSEFKRKYADMKCKDSILEETLSPMKSLSQCVGNVSKDIPIESVLEITETKTSITSRGASPTSKRKSWYSISSKKSEGCKPSAVDQVSLCDQTGSLKDQKVAAPQSIKHTQSDMPKTSSNDSITIIVTSPTSDAHPQQEDWSSTFSNTSSLSLSSISSTSSFDTTLLMPPSISATSMQKYPKSNEAPEVKKWLIGCMNRKADTLPRKLVYRMMEIYNIKENELDSNMLDKLREGIEDEGVVLQVHIEDESEGNKKEEFDGVEALRCLRTSFRSQAHGEGEKKREGKNISGHLNDTITTKRSSRNNGNLKEQSPPKKAIPGANPRVWQNPSSRVRNWPTTNINHSDGASFSFPPYTRTPTSSKHRTSSKPHNSYIYSGNSYSKRGICSPRRSSVISLSSIPEHDVSVGFDIKGTECGGTKPRPRSMSTNLPSRKGGK
ncbi:hypothetical protein NHQ30_007479 [Ciborinia camelliae]|nr:hypothetical protein NHQ30_007479 [Ciborinia camelliae]